MSGLKRVLKQFGRLKAGDVMWVYDYATDEAVKEEEMPTGSDRWKLSEKARYLDGIGTRTKLQCAARGCDGCRVCNDKSD